MIALGLFLLWTRTPRLWETAADLCLVFLAVTLLFILVSATVHTGQLFTSTPSRLLFLAPLWAGIMARALVGLYHSSALLLIALGLVGVFRVHSDIQ